MENHDSLGLHGLKKKNTLVPSTLSRLIRKAPGNGPSPHSSGEVLPWRMELCHR